jgi:PAS domain S-box-containing protein
MKKTRGAAGKGCDEQVAQRWSLIQIALDHLHEGFSVYDADLNLVACNTAFLDLLEFPAERFGQVGVPFSEFIRFNAERGEYGPGNPDELVAERIALAKSFVPHSFERTRPNGTVLEIHGNSMPGGGFVTIYKDITERKKAENALKESHERLESRVEQRTAELKALNERLRHESAERKRALEALRESEEWIRLIADNVPALIGYVDSSERYRFANKQYEKWFGLTSDLIVGRTVKEVLGPALYRDHEPYMKAALAGEAVTREFSLADRASKEVQAVASFVPHRDGQGAPLGYFVLGQDVTETRRADRVLRQLQKMEAIGQLTGGLAHDFNNLLTIVIGNLAALEEERTDDESLRAMIDPALDAARRGAELVRRLLAFARRQPLVPKPTDPSDLVAGMSELLRRTLGTAIRIETKLQENAWLVLADPHQLESAILNLAINSRDAMPEGGKLVIALDHVALDEHYATRHPHATPGDHVAIAVTDTGTGIPPEIIERVFDPFFTTKDTRHNSGLGLSMVYGFMCQLGGHVTIETGVGVGTTVRLYLPRVAATKDSAKPAVLGLPKGTERVLVVEDEAGVRAFVAGALRGLGYEVVEASDGPKALSALSPEMEIELLLTDIVMSGGISGGELARRVRRQRPKTKVLFMSGYPDGSFESATVLDEDAAFIAKPFEKEELARAVRGLIDRK